MGLVKEPFVVAQTISVLDPYDPNDSKVIELEGNMPQIVASVEVCVKQPQKTQVSLDSMAQIAVVECAKPADPVILNESLTFEVTYEIHRNGYVIATINDEMDYEGVNDGRHTNFPNFPLVDNNPICGINTYELVCTRVSNVNEVDIFVASRSLKATVFTS